ncbi:carbohydrate-binding module family 50 protein [Canariomyces notabilis]|uniref:Carbohydrate-binding module family 50 protein n=1 Tax=Canariomyces notabilis TaxID=2074819 RepID=A0AAN6T8D4_9PEZI|nr:carbohydrate-binding module family 50 protein [Canariomyces arenarius]
MLSALPLLALLFAGHAYAQTVNFMNITAPYQNFTTTCIGILNQAVACDSKIKLAGRAGAFESDATLASVCTASCTNALTIWARRVSQVCSTSRYSTDGKTSVLATFLAQGIVETYSALCLQDKQGKFCHAVVRDAFNSADSGTATTIAPSIACNTCVASILSTQAQMPIGYGQTQLRNQYSSLTSSCKLSSMALTSLATTTTWATSLPATPTPSCAGQTYTVRAGDNCRTVSFSRGISTVSLLTANNLRAYCANFPQPGGTLCIPTARVCKPYQLKADLSDTCHSIARAAGITWTQLVSWNPELGEYCEALPALAAGAGPVLCISQPGGGWTNPSPDPSTSTTTSYSETYFTLTPTPFPAKASTSLPTTAVTTTTTAIATTALFPMAGYVEPFANGSILDCHLHRPPPVRLNGSLTDSYLCADYAAFYGITLAQLLEWNPSLLEQQTSGGSGCYLWPGEKYCAQRDNSTGLAPGMTGACVDMRVAESGARGECEGFLAWYGLADAKGREAFGEWNPSVHVGGDCAGFRPGRTYCVAVRGFRAKGTFKDCSRWHLLQREDLAGGCGAVEARYGLTHGRFVAWNPVLGNDCSGLRVGYEYCVGTPLLPGTGG